MPFVFARRATSRSALAIIAALILGGAAWVAAAQPGSSKARVPAAPADADAFAQAAPTLVWECFSLIKGEDPRVRVRLFTNNFGRDDVAVRESGTYCETANKFRVPDATAALYPPQLRLAMQCYKLERGQDPDDDVILTTQNFGSHDATVRTAVMMCENAVKHIPGKPPFGDIALQSAWQCFKIDGHINPNLPMVLVTDNFGVDRVTVKRPVLMCESAIKYRRQLPPYGSVDEPGGGGVVTTRIIECFQVDAPNRQFNALLETRNFGRDEVQIRRANMLCEPGYKIRLFDADNGETPTGLND